ncbi:MULTISPECIES: M23 family metallopeptidase [unclassified Nocardia]|uniref:M23 family metallopeptidase n=1 Tax=unclassified Nocardia TaxID=2637762 RepID=UPI001CE4AB79|nr:MULTISPECIES: M23 family metallopeptidase [unclassified Nocardia]
MNHRAAGSQTSLRPTPSWSANEPWESGDERWHHTADTWADTGEWADTGAWSVPDSWAAEEALPAEETERPRKSAPVVIPGRRPARRGGAHRMPAPPAALKGRAAVAAVAAGAFVAAGQAAMATTGEPAAAAADYQAEGQVHEIANQSMSVDDPSASAISPQVLTVASPTNLNQFNDILQKGQKYAQDLAAKEAAKLRPLFTRFAEGTFTSGFGARWGVQHLGVDVAAPIGTPIHAVADGTVIEAGPAAGFGMWVRLLHDDGTVTVYGHVDTTTVSQGQRVLAGDQIATVGNRGFSTGPHCHFEVWLHGRDKVDPLPWLATRGISLGPERA